jgi:uncharacterized surface protein with fasciclin (FAS1) repeats
MKGKYDVVETANQTGHFRVFLQALEAVGIKQTLKETGPYTILAPVDDAFLKLPKAKLDNLFKKDNREALHLLLSNHIVAGSLPSTALKRHSEIRSMKDEVLRIESRAGLWVNEAQVITPDLIASNGVIHGIDTVLMHQTQGAPV